MRQDRRTFLKTTALAGVAAAGVPFTSTAPLAQKAAVGQDGPDVAAEINPLRRGRRKKHEINERSRERRSLHRGPFHREPFHREPSGA